MESWDYANLYINDPAQTNQAGWTKKRTLPNGRHSFEVALFKSNLYASITRSDYTGRTLVSTNMGSTWSTLLSQHSQYVVFDDFLFIEGDTDYIYDGQTLTTVTPNLIAYTLNTTRKVRYRDGVLYSLFPRYQLNTSPLYFITADQIENSGTATALPQFLTEKVRDIVVRSNVCYVMTVEEIQTDLLYRGQIYASSDLTNWPMATEFTVPGMPLSFEIMSNRFYVGLGSRFDGADWSRLTGPEAGSVWQVSPQPRLDYLDALTPGEVSLLVSLVPGFDFTLQSTPDLVSPLWSVVTATNALTDTYLITDPVLTNEAIRYYQITY